MKLTIEFKKTRYRMRLKALIKQARDMQKFGIYPMDETEFKGYILGLKLALEVLDTMDGDEDDTLDSTR